MPAARPGARHRAAAERAPFRALAALTAFVLGVAGAVFGVGGGAAVAAYPIDLSVRTEPGVLAGEPTTVTISASNPGTTDLYNFSATFQLPVGVTYVGGSTEPTTAGEPQVIPVYDTSDPPVLLHTMLVWSNISDLPNGDASEIGFSLSPDPTIFPVGASIDFAAASVFANSNPRLVPHFDGRGLPLPESYDASASEDPAPTTVSAIRISKSEPSPESELMRGVHDQTTTYELQVRNTTQGPTDAVVVVDYLPAGLEFLGCGGIDNSAAGTEEYPGAPRLTVVPAPSGPSGDCRTPYSVTTVSDPRPGMTGVFTRVEWHLGDFAPGQVTRISYRAAVPLFENTMTWPAPAPAPDGLDLEQAANLDNNTGALTRHVDEATTYTNRGIATGTYQGAIVPGGSRDQQVEATETIEASDLSVVKSASTLTFDSGEEVTFTLRIRTGEYTTVSGIEVVDTIPNGLCPLVPDLAAVLDPASAPVPSECYVSRAVDNATVTSVLANADGTYTVHMIPADGTADTNADFTVAYQALMLADYQDASNDPTVSGDSFTNLVDISATSTDVTTLESPVDEPVVDDSAATLGSLPPSIEKLVLPRPTAAGTVDCAEHAGEYVSSPPPTYRLGDTVCFQLRVDFSDSTETRDAQVQDFVPTGSSFLGWELAASSTVPADDISVDSSGLNADSPIFTIGAPGASPEDDHRYVAKGAVLVFYVWALIESAPESDSVDITANLMKYRQEATSGTVLSLRTQAEYGIAPAATMGIEKEITGSSNPVSGDGTVQRVQGGDTVDFSITVTNTGSAFVGNDFPVQDVDVWDALPAGFDCGTVSAITDGGTCTDPGDPGHPVFVGGGARSAIVWLLPGSLAASEDATVTYTITVPQGLGILQEFRNDASIVAFTSPNTSGGFTDYYPEDSLDPSHTPNTDSANDFEVTMVVPDASVTKSATPNLTIPGATGNQVVAGETVRYDYSVTVPYGTAVFNGSFSDQLPSGLTIAPGAVITATFGGTTYTSADIGPTGFTLSASGTLGFPDTYLNDTGDDQVFTVSIDHVLVGVGLSSGTLTNTASLASNATLDGDPNQPATGQTSVVVVSPDPSITKSASTTTNLVIGQTVTYTLQASNAAGRPTGFDPVVTDCLPGALEFAAFGTSPSGTTTETATGDGTNGCASGTTKLTWHIPAIAGGATTTLTFTATVGSSAAGLVPIANSATVTLSTLDTGTNDPAIELVISRTSAAATITVAGAATTKTVVLPSGANPQATVGETVSYSIAVTLPANVNFYKAFVQDTLPGTGSTPWLTGITNVAVTCVAASPAPSADCASDLPSGGSALTASGRSAGWYLGDVASRTWLRTVTVTFDATVADLPAIQRDTDLVNTARLRWRDASTGAAPVNAASNLDRAGTVGTATTINVKLPALTIAKDALTPVGGTATTIEPGQQLNFRITVTNPSNAYGSTAFGATVVDTVPAGVVVDTASVTGTGGVVTAGAAGTTVLTWTLPQLTNGGTAWSVTYQASLGASATVSGADLTNTAVVPSYRTLDGAGRTLAQISDTATVTPVFPSVQLSKAVAVGSLAYIGQSFGWRLTLANTGQGSAASVVPTDVLPPNWTIDAGATLTIGSTTTAFEPASTSISGGVQTIVWPTLGVLAPGQTAIIRYTATPGAAVVTNPGVGGSVQQTNTLSASTTDATGATGHGTPSVSYTSGPAAASAHIDSADVSIVKANGAALVAGTTTASAWTITVSNAGPNVAVGPFTVGDTASLPTGVTIVSAQGTGWVCGAPDGTGAFSCSRGNAGDTLASGASFPSITVTASTAADVVAGTEVTNSATVSARTYDPNTSNNSSGAITQVVGTQADLALTKTNPAGATAGQVATWTIGVTNLGPSLARYPIEVVDTLPAGIDLDSVNGSGTGWVCAEDSGELTCTYAGTPGGGLGIGSLPAITVTAFVLSATTGDVTNAATVSSPTYDPVPGNNTDSVTTTVNTATTLTITKDLLTDPLVPGADATYQLTVSNIGTPDARTVAITDPLPAGLAFVSATGTGWTCTTQAGETDLACTLAGTLAGGASTVLDVVVSTDSGLVGDVINTATVTWDPDGTASDTSNSGLTGQADFSIVKSQDQPGAVAGRTHTYTLTVTNLGPSDSPAGVVVTDVIPAGLTVTEVDAPDGWDCAEGQPVVCTSTEPILAGDPAAVFSIEVSIPADGGPATYLNTASVAGVLTDPDPTNNTSSVTTEVTDVADVEIFKVIAGGATTVVAGTELIYELEVVNSGPSVADTVTVTDQLPDGFTLVSMTGPAEWTCGASGCSITAMPLGTSAFMVTVLAASTIPAGTELENQGTVDWIDSAGVHDDTSSAWVTVTAEAELTLSKTPASQDAIAGADVPFTLTVGNDGPSMARGTIEVVDTLPPGLRYLSSDPGCTAGSVADDQPQTVTCEFEQDLPVGGQLVVDLLTTSDPSLGDVTLTNSATASSPTDPDGVSASADVTFDQEADLAIEKTHTAEAVAIGQELDFVLDVSNAGPSDATGVVVVDTLPAGIEYVDAEQSDPAWACIVDADDAKKVECALTGAVAPGTHAPVLVLTTTVTAEAYPDVDNVATVSSDIFDPDHDDNTSTDTVVVPPLVNLVLDKVHDGEVRIGEHATYLITVGNDGPTEDPTGVTVVDELPKGLSYVAATGDGVECAAEDEIVECLTGPIGVEDEVVITVTVAVLPDAPTEIVNTATAASRYAQGDPVEASDEVAVLPAHPLPVTGIALNIGLTVLAAALLLGIGLAARRVRYRVGS